MKILRNEDGQVMVLTIMSMTVLMGFMALALDVSSLYNARRRVQTAADAAAIAAAVSYEYNSSSSTAATAAGTAAGNSGISPANTTALNHNCSDTELKSNCVELFVGSNSSSPIVNAYHTSSGYFEAIVSQPNPSFFMNAFMALFHSSGFGNLPVTAKAVAGIVASTGCTDALDQVDANSFVTKGNATINSANCGINIDSSSSTALCNQGNGFIDAPYINVVGGQGTSGKCSKNTGSPVYPNSGSVTDPFNNMLGPNPATACTSSNTLTGTSYTGEQSKYSLVTASNGTTANVECFNPTGGGPVTISGTWGNSPSTNGDILVFETGVTIGGTTTVNGTMDVYNGNFIQGNNALSIYAPGSDSATTGTAGKSMTYDNIALMQPSTNLTACNTSDSSFQKALVSSSEPCLQLQFGSGFGTLDGYVYAPTSAIYIQDSGGVAQVAGIIAYTLYMSTGTLNITNYNTANSVSTRLSSIELVE